MKNPLSKVFLNSEQFWFRMILRSLIQDLVLILSRRVVTSSSPLLVLYYDILGFSYLSLKSVLVFKICPGCQFQSKYFLALLVGYCVFGRVLILTTLVLTNLLRLIDLDCDNEWFLESATHGLSLINLRSFIAYYSSSLIVIIPFILQQYQIIIILIMCILSIMYNNYCIIYILGNQSNKQMVKGLDSSQTDVTRVFLDYILSIFQKGMPLSVDKSHRIVLDQLIQTTSSTSKAYLKFQAIDLKPKIILRKRCNKPFLSIIPYNGDSNYPAYQSKDGSQITICLSDIRNKIQLKQNLDRQLVIAYQLHHKNHVQKSKKNKELLQLQQKQKQKLKQKLNLSQENDRILMKSLYRGCVMGYRNYLLSESQTNKMAKKCAQYLFMRRSQSNIPVDSLFRYASRLADQICI